FDVGSEYDPAVRRNIEPTQSVLRVIEVGGHAALSIYAASEWHSGETAMEIVGPLMIGADEFSDVAAEFATELCGAGGTAILEDIDGPVIRPHHDHGRWADIGTDEVTGLGHFAFQRDVVPGAPMKNLFDLALVDRGIGVDPIGDAREPLGRPNVTLRQRA